MAGSGDEALDFARAAVRYVDGGEGRADGLDLDQHYARTWAEAAFGKFVEVAGGTAALDEGEDAAALRAALFAETRGALERVIGDLPTTPWAYEQLANLHLWQGDQDSARARSKPASPSRPTTSACTSPSRAASATAPRARPRPLALHPAP